MLGIHSIKLLNRDVDITNVKKLIIDMLKEVQVSVDLSMEDNNIMFNRSGNSGTINDYCISIVQNKIVMSPGDKRREQLKRDYLSTYKLTLKQEQDVLNVFNILSKMGFTFNITNDVIACKKYAERTDNV